VQSSRVPKRKLKVGIVGCGVIGSLLAKACKRELSKKIELVGLHDIDEKKAKTLKNRLKISTPVLKLKRLIQKSDLVIEAASGKASLAVAKKAISAKRDVMAMSVGGLLNQPGLFQMAERKGCRIYLPSGATCGLDGAKAARIGKIKSATLTTRKPPKGLGLKSLKKDKVIFKGAAMKAVKLFPKNINVSAALSLAGIGPKKTHVKIIASPKVKRNIHEIELVGDFGRIYTRCENVPSRENPKTSMLAALSAIATLRGIVESVKIGT